jgi:hypothetical protein
LGSPETLSFQSSNECVTYCRGQAQAEDGFVLKMYKFVWANSGSYVLEIVKSLGFLTCPRECDEFVTMCKARAQARKAFDDGVYNVVWHIFDNEPQKVAALFGKISTPRNFNEFKSLCQTSCACADAVYTSLWNLTSANFGQVAQSLVLSDFAKNMGYVPKSCGQFLAHCRTQARNGGGAQLLKQAWYSCIDVANS